MILGKITDVVSLGEFEGNYIFEIRFKWFWLVPTKYIYYVDSSGMWRDGECGNYNSDVKKAVMAFRIRKHLEVDHEN